ncbi:PREDICTED: uncharacterized protein C16orf86 homolog isoform X2 [Chinchilla lanigera]|uniref:Chromosome 16 open reading frame 86 n=1 Tax=Chinchilla lanigera TaxID=34839 RepID=A0A8C2V0M0_CHILA|nr:PREDICTED: uncharacterized protein C16orf86 homolog isoform X2 [Chinchilla lanigera]
MAAEEAKKCPGAHEGTTLGQGRITECPVTGDQCLLPVQESSSSTQDEDKCPTAHCSEPEHQEEGLKQEEPGLEPEPEAGEEKGPKPVGSIEKPSNGLKKKPVKIEGELPPGTLPLKREELEASQSEPSPPAKQTKKAKKRKSLGAPVLPAVASTTCAPPEILERKAQRLRPLYQYINYCNPELNQAEEGNEEFKVDPKLELSLVPEEVGVKQLQDLLPMAGQPGLGLGLPCPSALVPPTPALAPLVEQAGVEPGGLPSLGASGCLKAEVDKSTQVDIDKMLSVCAALLVPPLSPQYK